MFRSPCSMIVSLIFARATTELIDGFAIKSNTVLSWSTSIYWKIHLAGRSIIILASWWRWVSLASFAAVIFKCIIHFINYLITCIPLCQHITIWLSVFALGIPSIQFVFKLTLLAAKFSKSLKTTTIIYPKVLSVTLIWISFTY